MFAKVFWKGESKCIWVDDLGNRERTEPAVVKFVEVFDLVVCAKCGFVNEYFVMDSEWGFNRCGW